MDRTAGRGIAGVKEPVDHIIRPLLPWRTDEGAITECGYDASKVKALTREAYIARLKEFGRQRTAMLTCMTCAETATRWGTWETDPRAALGREIEWERGGQYWARPRDDRGHRLADELAAIAALIEAHRDEFDAFIESNARRRDWLERKALIAKKPKPREPGGL
jgi:hypothetical protein